MWKKYIILIGILGLTLILFEYISRLPIDNRQIHSKILDLAISNINDNLGNLINPGFTVFEYENAKLQEIALKNEYDLTAVLLHWNRLDDVQTLLNIFFILICLNKLLYGIIIQILILHFIILK